MLFKRRVYGSAAEPGSESWLVTGGKRTAIRPPLLALGIPGPHIIIYELPGNCCDVLVY